MWYTKKEIQIPKVTSKYQITIPVSVRKTLGIIPGSEVDIVSKGDDFVLKTNL